MKFGFLFFALFFTTATIAVGQFANGFSNDGYIGTYDINGTHYWWLCVEPEGTPAANLGQSLIADAVSIETGWDNQNTERATLYSNSPAAQAALAKQVNIMEYVLDNFLPISILSTPGALTEDDENSSYYSNDVEFYNAMYAVQHFMSETYGKITRTDFTDLAADYTDRWAAANDFSASGISRSQLFQSILDAVELADQNDMFDVDYVPTNSYFILNSPYSLANNSDPTAGDFNWQDTLIIAIPVPEPSGALLIACCGLTVMLRRWRKLA